MTTDRTTRNRRCYLSTVDLYRLDRACRDLWALDDCGGVYLVGSASERPDFRDVDVRLILPDERFDALFGHAPELWGLFCYAVSRQLAADTGLPVDFQVQRQTEANAKHDGPRNPIGAGRRRFAGMGDATEFTPAAVPTGRRRDRLPDMW